MESSMGLKGGLLGQSHSSALTTEVSAFPLEHGRQTEVQEQRRKLKTARKIRGDLRPKLDLQAVWPGPSHQPGAILSWKKRFDLPLH